VMFSRGSDVMTFYFLSRTAWLGVRLTHIMQLVTWDKKTIMLGQRFPHLYIQLSLNILYIAQIPERATPRFVATRTIRAFLFITLMSKFTLPFLELVLV
jgi:hypothetical protein